jgi:hypothetical protein
VGLSSVMSLVITLLCTHISSAQGGGNKGRRT